MTIPEGYAQVQHTFGGALVPTGAMVTYGINHTLYGDEGQDAADFLYTTFQGAIMGRLSVDLFHTACIVKYGPDEDGPTFEHLESDNGGQSGSAMPPNVAYLIKKGTASGGRRNRGRMYLPGVAEANVDDTGLLNSVFLAAAGADFASFIGFLTAELLPMVILHDGPGAPTVVTSFQLDARAATQRRRLRR